MAARKSNFGKSLAQNNKSAWEKAKDAQPGGSYGFEVDDGNYVVQITKVEVRDETENKEKNYDWIFLFSMELVADGRGRVAKKGVKGQKATENVIINFNDSEEDQEKRIVRLVKTLKACTGITGEIKLENVESICANIAKSKPLVKISVKNWSNDEGKSGVNVFMNERFEGEIIGLDDDDDDDSSHLPEGQISGMEEEDDTEPEDAPFEDTEDDSEESGAYAVGDKISLWTNIEAEEYIDDENFIVTAYENGTYTVQGENSGTEYEGVTEEYLDAPLDL